METVELSRLVVKKMGNSDFPVESKPVVSGSVPTGVKDPLWYGLGFRLSQLRSNKELPANRLGCMSDLSYSTVGLIEDSERCPRIDTVELLAKSLAISPAWLAFGVEGFERFQQRRPRDLLDGDEMPEPSNGATEERFKAVGLRCAMVRKMRGQSLRTVAIAAGVSHASLALIEKGTSIPLVSTVERLAVALDVAPSWLAFGEGQEPDGLTA